jgi:hypothetical protein
VSVEPCGYTHGDFQYLNLLWNQGRVSAVLDWDRLDVRPVGLEVARSATLLFGCGDERVLDLARVNAFGNGYRQRRPVADLADAVHRLWWERVSNDLWQLRLQYDTPTHPATTCSSRRRPCWPGGPPTATQSPPRSPQANRGNGVGHAAYTAAYGVLRGQPN